MVIGRLYDVSITGLIAFSKVAWLVTVPMFLAVGEWD